MTEPIGMAMVGTGVASSRLHGPAIKRSSHSKLVAVCGRSKAKAQVVCDALETTDAEAFDSVDELLATGRCQALVIATPDGLHAETAIKAAEAGVAVLLEKPMALETADCLAIISAFEKSHASLALGYRMRFHRGHQAIMERLHGGEFGRLRLVRAHAALLDQGEAAWRNTEGLGNWWTLSKFGTHLIDQTLWAVNRPVSDIRSFSALVRKRKDTNDAEASGTWSYPDGTSVQLFCSNLWNSPSRIELHCQDASIYLNGTLGFDGGGEILIDSEAFGFEKCSEFDAQLADFEQVILGSGQPRCGGDVGIANVEVLKRFSTESEVAML